MKEHDTTHHMDPPHMNRRTLLQRAGAGSLAAGMLSTIEGASLLGAAAQSATPAALASPVADDLEALRGRLTGQLVTAGDPDYDEARSTLYINADRYPLAIVRAANATDVAAAVDFARDNDLPLAVRSGGHSLAHLSVIDDAIIADLSTMTSVDLDPPGLVARVQAGATTDDLAIPAEEYDLALSTGDTESVGMGGLVTGGGIGFMVRRHGLTIDSLLSAEVVTANGDIVTASESSHPDLFWAIRGGGGNVGIVTEFTFRMAPVPQVLGGELLLPASADVIRGYLDAATSASDDLTTIANLKYAPPAPFVPEERVGELVLSILVCWTGDIADGEQALAPLRALAEPVADVISPMPYRDIYAFTAHQADPHAASIRMMFADDLSDDTLESAMVAMQQASSPYSAFQLRVMGGEMARVEPDATAFAHRERNYFVAIIASWLDPEEDAAPHVEWTDSLWQAIQHESEGVYVNFLENEGAGRVHEAYPGDTFDRLAEIKRQYDPGNLFRFNQNVPPA